MKKEGSGGQPVRGRKRREARTFRSSFLRSLLLRPCAAATSLPLYLSHCSPFLFPSAPLARSFVSFLSVSLSRSHCFHFSPRLCSLSVVPLFSILFARSILLSSSAPTFLLSAASSSRSPTLLPRCLGVYSNFSPVSLRTRPAPPRPCHAETGSLRARYAGARKQARYQEAKKAAARRRHRIKRPKNPISLDVFALVLSGSGRFSSAPLLPSPLVPARVLAPTSRGFFEISP